MLIRLYDRKDLIRDCAILINEEWRMSETAREHMVERSANAEPPMAFLLMDNERNELLGYARLFWVLNINEGNCLMIDTVVIRREMRGRGLGKLFMNELKTEAIERGCKMLLLTTEDKVEFYIKCGYRRCQDLVPIADLGKKFPVAHRLASLTEQQQPQLLMDAEAVAGESSARVNTGSSAVQFKNAPPPPPPLNLKSNTVSNPQKVYMFCNL